MTLQERYQAFKIDWENNHSIIKAPSFSTWKLNYKDVLNEYNYLIDNEFRITIKAPTEAEAEKSAYDMYPEATKFDLMAIIKN